MLKLFTNYILPDVVRQCYQARKIPDRHEDGTGDLPVPNKADTLLHRYKASSYSKAV
ncbi:hypothetical protein DPMN_143565 [Dreissena polymorpha]|uniref:Uncharacterized protein n=1 Tax=Dreissena polymorpha TaxID=45954 RepID=A0A9D4JJS9_DREPO|nr:hypothetical protein DPMN_143565 [Dreissena polymorpha]